MDDPLILIAVLAASALSITALVLLNRWLGGWTPTQLDSVEAAGARLSDDVIGFRPGEGALAADRRAALVEEAGGDRLGVVIARGDRFVTRALGPREIIAVNREGLTLTLDLGDFTFSRVVVTLDDEAEARRFEAMARQLTKEPSGHAEPA